MLRPDLITEGLNPAPGASDRRILLFELGLGGHRPGYIQHLVRFWHQQNRSGTLHIIVRPEFIQRYPDIVSLAAKTEVSLDSQGQVQFVPITDAEEAATYFASNADPKTLDAREWTLLAHYAEKLRATHCLIMYFDFMKVPAALGQCMPCPFSGIYFRPTFHYDSFEYYHPTWRDRLQACYERALLSWVLRHQKLRTLFCLDPFVLESFDQFHSDVNPVYLPDPVQVYEHEAIDLKAFRETLGIEPNRKVFLLFGELSERKGLHRLLEAIPFLSSQDCQRLCLLLVGPISAESKPFLKTKLAQFSQSLPIQMISQDRFIGDRAIQPYFQLADVILAPYQRHVGSSAILVRAAAAQKPVLSSDYGLMGELTHRHRLGIAVDSTQASEIARGLKQCLLQSPDTLGDRHQMQRWAAQNSAEQFATVIFNNLLQ